MPMALDQRSLHVTGEEYALGCGQEMCALFYFRVLLMLIMMFYAERQFIWD